jgi:hypothetical protein
MYVKCTGRITRGHSPVPVPLRPPEIPPVAKNYTLCALGASRKGTSIWKDAEVQRIQRKGFRRPQLETSRFVC